MLAGLADPEIANVFHFQKKFLEIFQAIFHHILIICGYCETIICASGSACVNILWTVYVFYYALVIRYCRLLDMMVTCRQTRS